MEGEDIINLPASSNSGSDNENNEKCDFYHGLNELNSETCDSYCKQGKTDSDMEISEDEDRNKDGDNVVGTNEGKDVNDDPSVRQVSVYLAETITVVQEKLNHLRSRVPAENGGLSLQNETPFHSHTVDDIPLSGVKRARVTVDEQQPSVRVIYNSLTRASKQKLEQLLQQWSEWQAESSSLQDPGQVLESGEETYFPALCVGGEKSSAVSFWIDNQTGKKQKRGFVPLDDSNVPFYDRGYSLGLISADDSSNLEGGLEIIDDASRCFNCGSYNHALKECPKPRDNVAVNNARKQHKSKKNQNSGSRVVTRYYQNSLGGKYDDLKPGALGAETRQLLGLGELDPPPWLNRMRELGYPPGYLDPDDEDQPSGITIFGEEDIKEEQEDGEIMERDLPEPKRKMAVEFPGINAPIPENADERLWAPASSSDPSRRRSHHRIVSSAEPSSRGHHYEQRWVGDYRDDGPPGVDPVFSPSSSSYPPRHGEYDLGYSSYNSRDNFHRPRSPTIRRSHSERDRRSPLVYEDLVTQSPYSSPWYSTRFGHDNHGSRDEYNLDNRNRLDYEGHHHRSWR